MAIPGHMQPDKPAHPFFPEHADEYIEKLGLTKEQVDALSSFWTEKQAREEAEKRAADEAYQDEQAGVVLAHPGWSEIKYDWLDSARIRRDRLDYSVDELARTYVYDDDENEYSLTSLPPDADVPTIHQFYRDLYGVEVGTWTPDSRPILVNHRDRRHPYEVYDCYEDFIHAVTEETSFIYLGRFWEPTHANGLKFSIAKKNAMTEISGVCIDIDRVEDDKGQHFQASWVMESLFKFLDKTPELMPNYLMLSGTGIQLWYVFGEAIPLLSKTSPRRAKYDEFIKDLYRYFDEHLPKNRFKVDKACGAYNHAFRAPGSPSKAGYPARLFVYGGTAREMKDPVAMSEYIGSGLKPYDVGEWDPDYFAHITGAAPGGRGKPATEKQLEYIGKLHKMGCIDDETFSKAGDMTLGDADTAIKAGESSFVKGIHWRETHGGYVETTNGHRIRLKPRSRKLYDGTLARILAETKPGSRYMSMFVLAGLAYNCNVSKSALEHDLRSLMDSEWGRKPSPSDGHPITNKDIKSAMKGYNPIGCLRSKEIIEELVGWRFGPPAKRNGRTRMEHLQTDPRSYCVYVRKLHYEEQAAGKGKRLAEFLAENPSASKRAACKALGMSRTTVTKYWAEACAAAGVEDTRSGNHSPF